MGDNRRPPSMTTAVPAARAITSPRRENGGIRLTLQPPIESQSTQSLLPLESDRTALASPNARTASPLGSIPSSPNHIPLQVAPSRFAFEPITADKVQRYERKDYIINELVPYTVERVKTVFDHPTIEDWIPTVHPEGALYFRHAHENVFTDGNLFRPEILNDINEISEYLLALKKRLHAPNSADLVLEYEYKEEDPVCKYYLADHEQHVIFWLHECNLTDSIHIGGAKEDAHIRQMLEHHYWSHWELFPNSRSVDDNVFDHLQGMVTQSTLDSMTSRQSVAPYSILELSQMLDLVKKSRRIKHDGGHAAWIVGRLMAMFANQKFLHFSGQIGARLSKNQSVYGIQVKSRSLLFLLLSPICLWAPDMHLHELEAVFVDNLVNFSNWDAFIKELLKEWREQITWATVILTGTVGLLAIQSVDDAAGSDKRSWTQILGYISVILSTCNIATGLIRVRRHSRLYRTATEVASYLTLMSNPIAFHGLEGLAILFSLPFVFLIWSMVSFLAAFSFVCFNASSRKTIEVVGVVACAAFLLVAWTLMADWQLRDKLPWAAYRRYKENHPRRMTQSADSAGRMLRKGLVWSRFGRRQRPADLEKGK